MLYLSEVNIYSWRSKAQALYKENRKLTYPLYYIILYNGTKNSLVLFDCTIFIAASQRR